jgi:hypothetical protein
MMLRTTPLAVACFAAMLMLAPAGADAATPLTIGTGHKPGVAVDGAGTAYIAWYGNESTISSLQFCRLPRAATACDVAGPIAAPGTSLSRPFVAVDGSTVRVVSYRYGLTAPRFDEVWQFTSTDGGATFDAGHAIGITAFDEAVRGPGDTLSVATNAVTEGELFQNMPLGGGTAGDGRAPLSVDHPYNGTVGLVDAATPLVVFANGSSLAQFRRYAGAGSLNDPASWAPPVDIGYADYPRLAGGPAGLFLLAGTESNALVVRKWDGTTFNAGVTIADAGDDAQAHLTQDAAGRLHAVFGRGTAEGLQLQYATSDDGVTWRSGAVLTQPGAQAIGQLRAATASDHIGIATWETAAADGTPEVRVLGIGPTGGASPPVPGKSVAVGVVSGRVFVKAASGKRTRLTGGATIPVGAQVDTTKGRVQLTSAADGGGKTTQTADFYQGIFEVKQKLPKRNRATAALTTDIVLKGASRSQCAPLKGAAAAVASKKKGPKASLGKLWGNGKGKFRTNGKYSSATVRGTIWLTQERCDGTLTKVVRGSVRLRDRKRRKTVTVKAGHSYLARAQRAASKG